MFPEADANEDGILTMEEALAARSEFERLSGNRGGKVLKPDHENIVYGPYERNVLGSSASGLRSEASLKVRSQAGLGNQGLKLVCVAGCSQVHHRISP